MKRIVLVGEDRGKSMEPPLQGQTGHNLARILGIEWDDYMRSFHRANLFKKPSKRWDSELAKSMAARISCSHPRSRIVCLGRRVARAFDVNGDDGWNSVGDIIVIPHPSGRNRIYNDESARRRTRLLILGALGRIRG